jgi:hypothetical protein
VGGQISVIDVRGGQLAVAGVSGSAGAGPLSLTYGGGLLYVLNAANASDSPANVAGFSVDSSGALHSIPGAIRPLSSAHPNPAQVLLDPQRHTLLVTEKGTNLIDVYQVGGDGSLTGPTTVHSSGNIPFGMSFVQSGGQSEVIVADAAAAPYGTGGVTAYSLVDRLLNLQARGRFCDAMRHSPIHADGIDLRLVAVPVKGDEARVRERLRASRDGGCDRPRVRSNAAQTGNRHRDPELLGVGA